MAEIIENVQSEIVGAHIVSYIIFNHGISMTDTSTKESVFVEMTAKKKVMIDCAYRELLKKLAKSELQHFKAKTADSLQKIDELIDLIEDKSESTRLKLFKVAIGNFLAN